MHRRSVGLRTIVAIALIAVLVVSPVSAAGETDVELRPSEATVDEGETVSYDVYVANASEGVGSVDFELRIAQGNIASFEDVSYEGNPSFTSGEASGDAMRFVATGMNTADSGSVQVGTVEVAGDTAGTTTIELDGGDLSDEPGRSYTIADTRGASLEVESTDDSLPDDDDDHDDEDSSSDSDDDSDDDSTDESDETDDGDEEDEQSGESEDEEPGEAPDENSPQENDPSGDSSDDDGLPTIAIVIGAALIVLLVSGLLYVYQ